MALKVKRQDDLDSMFGKFAQMDPKDEKRDKFLKRADAHKDNKRAKGLTKTDQEKIEHDNQ
ncbi:SPJ_0845 family protein [Levilactobacillus zymae]|uniref:SPJ_0845 family protein n=1 Tax=Levilactobacillus zymae TaxID=267363 RepID=UPI0028B976D0|nr:SPJ_0845 family protein [Levilactobacillus zymae]MDT6980424.1 SPJ_0845 family protein [Levilactobacillus zymae]